MATSFDDLIARFDVDDLAFIEDPYPVLNALREATPIFWNPATDQWMITRFSDVSEMLRDRRFGHGVPRTDDVAGDERSRPELDLRWPNFAEHERWSLLSIDPPDHTRLRRLISKVFTPRAVAALEPTVRSISADLLRECRESGRFELLADYAQPFSVAVICSMLGVPRADTQLLLDWSHAIVKMYELSSSDDTKAMAEAASREFIEYTRALIADKRRSPDGLLVSELVGVEDDGDTLSEDEIVCTTMVVLEAGHEATVNTLGNGTRALMKHRDQWHRLTSGDVTPRESVEELLRWDAPLHLFERSVQQDGVEVGGQALAVGDQVAMLFGSAQRDPRRFDDPDRFDIGRNDTAHIGFGAGVHFCVGAPLARQELSVSIEGLVGGFPGLELAEEPTYHPTFVIRGLTALELTA